MQVFERSSTTPPSELFFCPSRYIGCLCVPFPLCVYFQLHVFAHIRKNANTNQLEIRHIYVLHKTDGSQVDLHTYATTQTQINLRFVTFTPYTKLTNLKLIGLAFRYSLCAFSFEIQLHCLRTPIEKFS